MDIKSFIEGVCNADDILIAEGFDGAFVGICRRFGNYCALYDYVKCVEIIVEREKLNYDDAIDVMENNVVGFYIGRNAPVFLMDKI